MTSSSSPATASSAFAAASLVVDADGTSPAQRATAERSATLACVCAALTAPAGVAGGFLGQTFVTSLDALRSSQLALAVAVAVVPPLALALLASTWASRAGATMSLRRARIARRVSTPFAFVGAIAGFLVALGAVFESAFLQ